MMMNMGGSVNLKVSDELKAAVSGAVAANVRAIKVNIQQKEETLSLGSTIPVGATMAQDWAGVGGLVEDGVPCVVLVRMKKAEGDNEARDAADNAWVMIGWTPSDSPVKLRMLSASSRKGLKDAFGAEFAFKELPVTDHDELTYAAFQEATREMTNDERRDAMSQSERDAEDTKAEVAKELKTAPKMLAGLVSLKINSEASFTDAVKALMSGDGNAVIGKLVGAKGEDLSGEVMAGIASPSGLKGKLADDVPCYVLLKLSAEKLLLISWLPENSPVKPRMKMSTFKSSVISLVKELTSITTVATSEVQGEDWLTDDLGSAPAREEEEVGAAPKKHGGPPPGAVAMPGMGAMGGFKLPGMGDK